MMRAQLPYGRQPIANPQHTRAQLAFEDLGQLEILRAPARLAGTIDRHGATVPYGFKPDRYSYGTGRTVQVTSTRKTARIGPLRRAS
jgi:hypothetical protein